jgi:hypothetical protein
MKEQKKMRLNRYLKKTDFKRLHSAKNVQGKNYLHAFILAFLPIDPAK